MIYIGQTKNTLEERAQSGGSNYRECRYFWNAINKYGWDNFTPEILKDNLSREEANYWEKYYISLYDSTNRDVGYNIQCGGNNTELLDETKLIISQKAKDRYSDKTKNPMYGKKHSEDSIEKMSKKKVGSNNPMYGKHLSEESIAKANETKRKNNSFYRPKYTEEQLIEISKKFKEVAKQFQKTVRCIEDDICFDSITKCAEYYNTSFSNLSGHLNGRQNTCCGKHFEFVN